MMSICLLLGISISIASHDDSVMIWDGMVCGMVWYGMVWYGMWHAVYDVYLFDVSKHASIHSLCKSVVCELFGCWCDC